MSTSSPPLKSFLSFGICSANARGKPILSLIEKWAVGGECNRLWCALSEQRAMAEYRARPNLVDAKKLQSELVSVPVDVRNSRVHRDAFRQASSDIADIFSNIETQPIRMKRPYGKRTEILDAAIRWCAANYSKPISRRRAQDCWDAFSAVMKRREREPT
jgi:hypothetical protein